MKSRRHKKTVEKLKRYEKLKRKSQIELVSTLENFKKMKENEATTTNTTDNQTNTKTADISI